MNFVVEGPLPASTDVVIAASIATLARAKLPEGIFPFLCSHIINALINSTPHQTVPSLDRIRTSWVVPDFRGKTFLNSIDEKWIEAPLLTLGNSHSMSTLTYLTSENYETDNVQEASWVIQLILTRWAVSLCPRTPAMEQTAMSFSPVSIDIEPLRGMVKETLSKLLGH